MTIRGIFQTERNGEIARYTGFRFVHTGIKYHDKVIWRRLKKDGTPTNCFCEQYKDPYGMGSFFYELNSGGILRIYPELKVSSPKSDKMSHEEYCEWLERQYFENRREDYEEHKRIYG